MTNELIAILATGVALLGSVGAMWFNMHREIGGLRSGVGGLRSEVRGVRTDMSRLNSHWARIDGMLLALVASRRLPTQDPASATGEIKKKLAGFGMWKHHAQVRDVDTCVSEHGLLVKPVNRRRQPLNYTERELLAGLTPETAHADELAHLTDIESDD